MQTESFFDFVLQQLHLLTIMTLNRSSVAEESFSFSSLLPLEELKLVCL